MNNTRHHGKKLRTSLFGLTALSLFVLAGCQPGSDSTNTSSSEPTSSQSGSDNNSSSQPYDEEEKYTFEDGYERQLRAKGKFHTDYATIHQAFVAGSNLNKTIAEEGFVLLKNENGALPLSPFESRLTALGYRSCNLQEGGSGSGAAQVRYLETEGLERSTLRTSLEEVGLELNPVTEAYYEENNTAETDPATYPNSLLSSYNDYHDAALIVISRGGGEGGDLRAEKDETGRHQLQLTLTEEALVRHAKAHFKKVIVLLNSANTMEVGALAEAKTDTNLGVDAILQIGHVGVDGAYAIGRILTGEVSPSGHTVDTWERDFTKGPSYTNFGPMSQNGTDPTTGEAYNNHYYIDGEDANSSVNRQSLEYREDIYMGYKWYETAYEDLNAAQSGSGDTWYQNAVVYPFGYGLSYTTFDWKIASTTAPTAKIASADSTVTIKVEVTNTGSVAGKDVVEIYAEPPYEKDGIEKSAVNLMGFAKTDLLNPGESQIVTVQFAAQDMASFDWDDKNNNGFAGYELEAGDYVISARSDAHTVKASVTRTIESDILCRTDLSTGKTIRTIFSQEEGDLAAYNSTNESLVSHLASRADGLTGTAPAPSTSTDRTITTADVDGWRANADVPAYADDESDPWYIDAVSETWTQESTRESGQGKTATQLYDMAGVSYTDPTVSEDGTVTLATDEDSKKWDSFMNQLTWEEMEAFALAGGWGRRAIPAIGKPEEADQDGPNQLGTQAGRADPSVSPSVPSRGGDLNNGNGTGSGVSFISEVIVASTWNTYLASEEGRIMGNFSLFLNIPGWYGPGMNLHRSPFGGRNFEYYSEDGVLSGKMAAAVIRGATEKGVVCYAKHFAFNEQETNRSSVNTFVTEQAMREIYLKPFEIAAKEGGSMGFMTSMAFLGTWALASNGALQKELMRNEWGYKGVFITDANGTGGAYKNLGIMFRNGTDINLARATMITTDTADDNIINAEATYWDPTARNGKGMVMAAPDEETRQTAYQTLHNGWTEGIGGTTEFKFYNWRDKSTVSSMLTYATPTYYYWLRLAVLHTLYNSANSNALNNGMPSWMYYGDIVNEVSISGAIQSDNSVTFDKKVTDGLTLEDGVEVTGVTLAQTKDLPDYTTAAISEETLNQLVEEGRTEILSNADIPEWLCVDNAGNLYVDGTPVAGTYRPIFAVKLDYYHVINVRATVVIQ